MAVAEKMLSSAFRLTGDILFACVEPLAQIVGRQVGRCGFIGGIKKGIGDGCAHLNPRDAAHHSVQTFKMLCVHGGEDVDYRFQQLFDILPALRIA
ncbi:hypothetical protein NGUA31_01906 [Salmonella enterica]|nr:hypothetical protein NGUA31_01906 [Salmonella enterica]